MLLALLACLPEPAPDTADSQLPDAPVRVADVLDGAASSGVLEQVVVTTPVTRAGDGVFVRDVDDGACVFVALPSGVGELSLVEGQVLDVQGRTREVQGWVQWQASWQGVAVVDAVDGLEPVPVDDPDSSWVGCLVRVQDTVESGTDAFGDATLASGWIVDKLLGDIGLETGQVLHVTGAVSWRLDQLRLSPRRPSDVQEIP